MKAEDLMIGDWVNVFGVLKQIEGIRKFQNGDEIVYYDGDNGNFIKSVTSIPLTREILEKNGFYKINAMEAELDVEGEDTVYSLEIKEPYTIVEVEDTDQDLRWVNLRVKGEGCEKLVQYVHELQHVFRFFGVEKEIVL